MLICPHCGVVSIDGERHVCRVRWQRPDQDHYGAVILLVAVVIAGSHPLIAATGGCVVAAAVIVLLWIGLPLIVTRLVRRPRWAAAVANACTMLSTMVWPDPHMPYKLVDSGTWGFIGIMAGLAIGVSVVVTTAVRQE